MADPAKLLELAARCEAASEADRWLDGDIWLVLGFGPKPEQCRGAFGYQRACGDSDGGEWRAPEFNQPAPDRVMRAPAYTASLDAAVSLVPEGADWIIDSFGGKGGGPSASVCLAGDRFDAGRKTATPAAALTAACLLARAAAEQHQKKEPTE